MTLLYGTVFFWLKQQNAVPPRRVLLLMTGSAFLMVLAAHSRQSH
jgi:hypothetical protein